ncbi:hypothetical protein ACJ72_00205 [Emergomyces africanus]|uniref:Uncharacterized protein n=1 Tax=Emergomyces africanus TaxID=1955775 RepID=A0A1B7P8S1_9EURO|nr:hypothetical protein ACJ72_00205 [Emergomyces africanus]
MLAPIESLRATFVLYARELGRAAFEAPAGLSVVEARCRADVKFEACCPGGETDVFRDAILMGDVGPSIVCLPGGRGAEEAEEKKVEDEVEGGKSGKEESSRSGFRRQKKYKSRSRSAVRDFDEVAAKPMGVPIGVVSRVEEWSWSLLGGEYWREGGVSEENWGIKVEKKARARERREKKKKKNRDGSNCAATLLLVLGVGLVVVGGWKWGQLKRRDSVTLGDVERFKRRKLGQK